MITIMNANEMMPNWAIENATPVDLAIMNVAAAVPGPQITRAPVPTNSAANFLDRVTSAIRSAHNTRGTGAVSLTSFRGYEVSGGETMFGSTEHYFAEVSASIRVVSIGVVRRPYAPPVPPPGDGADH